MMASNQEIDSSMEPLQPDYLRITRLIGLLQCMVASFAGAIVSWLVLGFTWYYSLLVFVGLAGILFILLSWYLKHWYLKYAYQLDDDCLTIKRGVFWRCHISVPISRVQHVDVNSGPLERRYGLAKLVVNTAGTHHAQTVLPGLSLEQAYELRDQLLAMQEGDTV